jgi:hypothetical protein
MLEMDGSRSPKHSLKPGLRALDACGEGFWELDLEDGSAWYSRWFYQKLNWTPDAKRPTLAYLEPLFEPACWTELMARFRAHLEQGLPLDLEVEVRVRPDATERWQIRGSAHRNDAGQPMHLAGIMRELGSGRQRAGGASELLCASESLCTNGAFESLPVAAALLDARASLLKANRQWYAFPAATTAQALSRLRAANSQTAIEFWLDQGDGFEAGPRRLRVRALAFQHEESRHLAVTLEDRRSD